MKKQLLLLLLIPLVLAFALRFYKMSEVPNSLHKDEMVNVYAGRFVLDNGYDVYGNKFPLFYFNKFGDYPPVFPMYVQAAGTYIFGLNEFGARAVIGFMGVLLVIPVFFITRFIFNSTQTALFASILTAVIPWQILFSRMSAEGMVASFFYFYGLLLVFISLYTKRIIYMFLSIPFFLITYISYPAFRIVTPLTLLPIPLFFMSKKLSRTFWYSVLIVALFAAVTVGVTRTNWAKGRFDQVSIFHIVSGVNNTNQQLIFREDNIYIARLFNNKIVGFSREFLSQYTSYFSGPFLFFKGGGEITYKVPNHGELYLTMLVLFILPLFHFFRKRVTNIRTDFFYYVMYLLAISPIPGALTVIAVPNPHRAITMGIFLIIAAAYGFHALSKMRIIKVPVTVLVYLFIALETIFFMHNYITHVDYIQFIGNNDQAREMNAYVQEHKDAYEAIYMPSQDYLSVYYLFFAKDFNKDLIGQFSSENLRLEKRGKVHFHPNDCPSEKIVKAYNEGEKLSGSILLVERDGCTVPEHIKLEPVASFINAYGSPSFVLKKYDPRSQ